MNVAINTVVNAFHYRTLVLMAEMADALGKSADAGDFRRDSERVRAAFNAKLFDPDARVYVDGDGSKHASLHANLFALAFDLVPDDRRPKVIDFVKSRGMACSPYAAQYLLEALFENGQADYAIALMTSKDERSWRHMLDVGATITMEAWDAKFKPNLDWNHAWGRPGEYHSSLHSRRSADDAGFRKSWSSPSPGRCAHRRNRPDPAGRSW